MSTIQTKIEQPKEVILREGKVIRREVSFPSQGVLIRGWLYLPAEKAKAPYPAVVTANALTAVKEITLPGYAERFAEAGFVTLVFDYRFWGESEGEPRNQIIMHEMHQDIRNATTWLSTQPEVDHEKIGGWGVSLGGGHMLFLATFEPRLKAVVATATAVYTPPELQAGSKEAFRNFITQLGQDRIQRYKTGSPATHKTAWGKYGQDVLFPVEEAYDFYMNAQKTVAPKFENRATIQSMENLVQYNPDYAIHLASPTAVLIVHAEKDVIPVGLVRNVFDRTLEPKKLVVYDCKHTDLYDKEPWLTKSANEAIEWFKKYLS